MRKSAGRPPLPWQGLVAGAIGGLVASWAMEQVQARFSQATGDGLDAAPRQRSREPAVPARSQDEAGGQTDPARVETAGAAVMSTVGRHLAPVEQAGSLLHYGFGTAVGAVYGVLVETRPELTRLGGIPFGLGVWASADEVGVAAAGISAPPWNRPMRAHTYSLLSHAVYGLTTEAVRKAVRARLH